MRFLFIFLLSSFCGQCYPQVKTIGIFDSSADIGNPKNPGAAHYDDTTQTYNIKGSGYNIWFNRDEFHYLYKKISGDFIITADFSFVGDKGDAHKKIGWMLRESLDEGAASYNAVTHGDGLTVLQWRPLRGAYMRDPQEEIFYAKKVVFRTIQMERSGKTITMRVANGGEPLQDVGSTEMYSMKDEVFAGLFISSHDSDRIEEAKMWNVRIDRPLHNKYSPNPQIVFPPVQGVMGSRLEIMNVFNGERKVIHETTGRIEAPNWMPQGKNVLFNEKGSLYTLPIGGGIPQKLNTGAADKINNDHGISPDGKMLAISHQRTGLPDGGSTVYVLPVTGGDPKLITTKSPSYWHGWSPNGKEITVVGRRNSSKNFNLYKVSVNNGAEIPLTNNTTGHVDGPEYSPDGKYIYYNANPSGTMQIWRMKPDGSAKEQLTFDERHNWFPHISPDGKWMVYISFLTDIDPNSHPTYQKVTLNLMQVSGGAPKVIAYLYGGQGTINVNSWSPDSKHIAFVSNSEKY
ncbi:MAG: hypothetical protein WKI04_14700 [Ferruginibacter sp.]